MIKQKQENGEWATKLYLQAKRYLTTNYTDASYGGPSLTLGWCPTMQAHWHMTYMQAINMSTDHNIVKPSWNDWVANNAIKITNKSGTSKENLKNKPSVSACYPYPKNWKHHQIQQWQMCDEPVPSGRQHEIPDETSPTESRHCLLHCPVKYSQQSTLNSMDVKYHHPSIPIQWIRHQSNKKEQDKAETPCNTK